MRRPLAMRRAAAALVVPLALATLTSCGSDTSEDKEPTGSSAAAEPEVAAGEEVPVAEFMDSLQDAFEGASTAHVTMENDGELGMSAEGDVDYSTQPPSMSITMENEMLGGEIEAILVDGVMYMKAPGMGGGKYLKMDVADAVEGLDAGLSDQMDPRKALGAMEKAVESVTFVGEEDVDGEEMAHYSLLIDTTNLVGEKAVAGAAGMPEELTYEVWFDQDGLFRRTEMDMGQTAGKMVMTLSDWGKGIEVEAPPADQVTEMPEMPEMPQMPSAPPTAGS